MRQSNLNWGWLALMAWRDSRKNKSRLLLFMSSIVLGIAALVAIYSLGDNLQETIDEQAAALLGADLEVSDNKPVIGKIAGLLDSVPGARSEEISFASMVVFPKAQGTRLAQVRALEGAFPYYGKLETEPAAAEAGFRNKQEALVDQTLMIQFGAKPGDSIRVGELGFRIAGSLMQAPGQTGIAASVAPSVYIPLRYVEQTGLLQKGSRINYRYYFKIADPKLTDQVLKKLEPAFELEDVGYRTVEGQKRDTGRSFQNLTRFMGLIGFVALLLGCVGVASAIHIYIREKLRSVAILRCLGVSSVQAVLIYLIQIAALGLIGSVFGALLGVVIQQFLPAVIQDFLPFTLSTALSFKSILQGVVLGTVISVLFALLPLIGLRRVSPLNVLRTSIDSTVGDSDRWRWVVGLLIVASVAVFSRVQMQKWTEALLFTGGVLLAFAVLTGVARLLMWLVRRFFPTSWGYVSRQGMANLFRPNNQTATLIVSVGLGTMFICILIFTQSTLLNGLKLSTDPDQPNMVLFDIQPGQRDGVQQLIEARNLPVLQMVPIVNMRLDRINQLTTRDVLADTTKKRMRGTFSREYRVTFRDSLIDTEKIVKGKWEGKAAPGQLVPISIEDGLAERANLKVNDTMVFNVQGTRIPTRVASIREVNWGAVQTNFLVIFPAGVLEEAPQFHVLLTHLPDPKASAGLQRQIVERYPNVSIVDLGLVLSVLDTLTTKIGFVIRFMAGFSILTGLIVLIASVMISKYQRIRESVLLRTLGASRRQVLLINALEYFFLGCLAAITGIGLATLGGWLLARYSFDADFQFEPLLMLTVFVSVTLLTVVIGLLNSLGVLSRSPLEVLRQED